LRGGRAPGGAGCEDDGRKEPEGKAMW
jgi:hypothetical protein